MGTSALSSSSGKWSTAQLIGFRFIAAYFVLYDLPIALGSVPLIGRVAGYLFTWMQSLSLWTGAHVLHLSKPIIIAPTGSGDTMIGWVSNFVTLALAVMIALVWSGLDRHRRDYRKLYEWLRILVRFALAFTMFGYGFNKIFPLQFGRPGLERLVEPFGDLSPMGLLWSFMGYSIAYNIFSGTGEALGGLLLCFRRTTTAGALLLITVLGNVVILNFAYDVPVKLFSTNLLLMAIFLAAPDMPRIYNLIVRHRPTQPTEIKPLFATPPMHMTSMVLRALLLAQVLYAQVKFGRQAYVASQSESSKPLLYGIYDVQQLTRNGQPVPLLVTDSVLWKRVVFSKFDRVSVQLMNDSFSRFTAKVDTIHQTVALKSRFDSTRSMMFAYARPSLGQLVLSGRVGSDSVVATLKLSEKKYLLLSRGFNWVQEQPFNR